MFSLVISAPGVLSNPLPDTPTIPDVQSNIIYELDAASLAALADGAAVDTWLANGPAPIVNRTFNFQYTGWGKPKFSLTGGPGGNPAVLFDGTQQIGNGAGTVAVAQSMTYAMVVKASVFAANQARLMASGAQILAPGANGFYESISAASRLESGDKSTEWTVILAVFDGPMSKIKVGTSPIVEGATGVSLSGRNILGGQGSALATAGLVGGYAFVRAYDRALNNSDIEAASIELHRAYAIS